MLWQQPHHDHFIQMPETAWPSLLPFNYLPVSLKISASDPVTLSGGEKKVYQATGSSLASDKYCVNVSQDFR